MWNINNIDGIIFDMDGVIFDSENLGMRVWHIMGDKYHLENIRETAGRCIGRSKTDSWQIFKEAYGDHISIDKLYNESRKVLKEIIDTEGMPLKSGVKDILEYLKVNNVKLALASSTQYETVVRQLTDAGLINYFQVIIGGDMVEKSKPEPEIYLLACKNLGVEPKNTIAVEDSRNGIISAYRAGMIPVMIPDLISPDEEIKSMANKILSNLSEFLEYLKN